MLAGGDWRRFRPKVIVIEAVMPGSGEPAWGEWEPFLLAQGYRFALFDTLNRFYVAQEHPEILARLPSERAPWDKVVHMYEIGRAPENANHPDHALAKSWRAGSGRACPISIASSSPRSWRAPARRAAVPAQSLPTRSTPRRFAPRPRPHRLRL